MQFRKLCRKSDKKMRIMQSENICPEAEIKEEHWENNENLEDSDFILSEADLELSPDLEFVTVDDDEG